MTIFKLFFNLLFKPQLLWAILKIKKYTVWQVCLFYAFPFIVLASFLNAFSFSLPLETNTKQFIISILSNFSAVILSIYLINELIPRYKGQKNIHHVALVLVISSTPFFLSSLFLFLLPQPTTVLLIAIAFSLYPFSNGLKNILNIPESMIVGLVIISLIIFLGVLHFINFLFLIISGH